MFKNYLLLLSFIFFASNSLFAQQLHHQMISSQGVSTTTSSGLIVKQTVGQQSVSGNSRGDIIVQQGFQQSYWQELLKDASNSRVAVTTFPNPFREVISFQFSASIDSTVQVTIFDSYGRSVFEKTSTVSDNLLKLVDLPPLPNAQYLVRLSGKNLNYFTTIIKI
jgi:hypothetical protein